MPPPNLSENTIMLMVDYSFQGEHHELQASFEVSVLNDLLIEGNESAMHSIIASQNNLDTYSYAFEIMQMQPIHYKDASGLIAHFIEDGRLDVPSYLENLQAKPYRLTPEHDEKLTETDLNTLADIARNHLNIERLQDHSDVLDALKAAWRAGRSTHAG